jgi:hypothetical protein
MGEAEQKGLGGPLPHWLKGTAELRVAFFFVCSECSAEDSMWFHAVEMKHAQASNIVIPLQSQRLTPAFCGHTSTSFELKLKTHGRCKSRDQHSTWAALTFLSMSVM